MNHNNKIPDAIAFIPENIRAARLMRGLNQQQLAKAAKLSTSSIVKIERGEVFARSETFQAIADALNIPLIDLFKHDQTQVEKKRVEPMEYREILRGVLAMFQYKLEPTNFIRKDPGAIDAFMATRDREEAMAFKKAAEKRLADLDGIKKPRRRSS